MLLISQAQQQQRLQQIAIPGSKPTLIDLQRQSKSPSVTLSSGGAPTSSVSSDSLHYKNQILRQ